MESLAGRTAGGAGAIRAAEYFVPGGERLFVDPLLAALLPVPLRWMMAVPATRRWFLAAIEREAPGTYGGLVCRTRFIDDVARRFAASGGRSVVVIGAGMDTRAYRLEELQATVVWEVDLPGVQAVKTQRVRRALGYAPSHVRFVPVDLARERLASTLDQAGFSRVVPTLVIVEGVMQYLDGVEADDLFAFAASCASGSEIAFTYVPCAIIDGTSEPPGARATLARMRRAGHPWRTGLDPECLGGWLHERGLHLVEQADAALYRERYLTPIGRELPVFELEHAAVARVV